MHHFQVGMIVQARGHLWRLDSVSAETVTGTSLDNPEAKARTFFLPLEKAGISIKQMGLPPREAGDSVVHDLFLRATRMTMMHGTAPLASLQRSRVIPTNYQLVPVMMALDMPRVRLLIADDVGLGKTIEAGLITLELLARKQAERVLVLTPANLRDQWRDAFDHFFHVPLEPLSTSEIRKLGRRLPPGANPWGHFPYVVASIDYAKQDTVKNLILHQNWDLVIVDEAHGAAAPALGARGSADKERYDFVQRLARQCKHLLLTTATPHNGYSASFASLLRMLDETQEGSRISYPLGLVDGDVNEPIIRRQRAKRHIVQRRRKDVQDWFEREHKRSPFPKRNSKEVLIEPSKPELEVYRAFQSYQRFIFGDKRASDVHVLARWMVMHFLRRATSSPNALKESLKNRIDKLQRKLEQPDEDDEQVTRSVTDAYKGAVLDVGSSELFDEIELDDKLDKLSILERAEMQGEIGFLQAVLTAVNRWQPGSDTKLKKLRDLLSDVGELGRYPRTIVFTRYVDTMTYLARELTKDGSFQIFTVDGSLNDRARAERIQAFQDCERGVLVATDAISEGLNLQFAANQLVHYELPWNPNRLEQRNGRVDRFKQPKDEVRIRTLINERSFDLVVFRKLIQKAERIREAYGFLPAYFSDEKYTEDLVEALISDNLTEQRFMQPGLFSVAAEEMLSDDEKALVEKMESESFYGQANFNLPDVEERLKASQDIIGSPAEVERLVIDAFRYLDWQVEDHKDSIYTVRRGGATPLAGVPDDLGQITFTADKAAMNAELNQLDIAHPVVSKLLDYIKRLSYGRLNEARTAVTTRHLAPGTPAHAVFHVRARFIVGEGSGSSPQLIEGLIPVGVNLTGGQVLGASGAQELLSAPSRPTDFPPNLVQSLVNKAHGLPDLTRIVERAVQQEAARVADERGKLREHLAATYAEQPNWLEGIDRVNPAAHDIIALTVILPARGN